MASAQEFEGPTTELLQTLIRNECVNDGTPDSGAETRSSDTLRQYLEGAGLDLQTYTPRPGATRSSPGSRAPIPTPLRCA